MNRKGFNLVELLAVIVIIALISGLCTLAYTKYINRNNPLFYKVIEENVELAANDYIKDHQNKILDGNIKEIYLGDLVDEKYIEKVIDVNGNICNGKIIVIKEKNNNKYEVCLDCGEYKSSGPYCK